MTQKDPNRTVEINEYGEFDLPEEFAEAEDFTIRSPDHTLNVVDGESIKKGIFRPPPINKQEEVLNPSLSPDLVSLKIDEGDHEPILFRVENVNELDPEILSGKINEEILKKDRS